LIVDEIGYLPVRSGGGGGDLFFQLVNSLPQRCHRQLGRCRRHSPHAAALPRSSSCGFGRHEEGLGAPCALRRYFRFAPPVDAPLDAADALLIRCHIDPSHKS